MTTRSLFSSLTAALLLVAAVPSAFAGAVSPVNLLTSVNAYGRDRFEPTLFRGGEIARVVVRGDGDTDLDLYIYDSYGNLVAKDDDGLDYCVATFRPSRTAYYTVVVRNLGSVYNRYTLTTN